MKLTLSGFVPVQVYSLSVFITLSSVLLGNPEPVQAQTQQPLIIAIHNTPAQQAGSIALVRDDTTGAITLLPNSGATFSQNCSPYVIEAKQQFMYGACGDGLSMYSLDGSTGVVTEIPTSPFTASIGNYSAAIVPEATGQYVYLIKVSSFDETSSLTVSMDTFQVDRSTPALIPMSTQTLPFTGAYANIVGDPNGHGFSVLLNQDQGGSEPAALFYTVLFDLATGLPNVPSSAITLGSKANTLKLSAKGNYLAISYGTSDEFLTVSQLSTTDFHIINTTTQTFAPVGFPRGLVFDPSGEFLYLQTETTDPVEGTYFLILNSSNLAETASSPLPFDDAVIIACGANQDPFGPFSYCPHYVQPGNSAEVAGIDVYKIDPITGFPVQPAPLTTTFYPQLNVFPMIYTGNGSGQPSSGPSLDWSPTSLTFGSTFIGQTNGPQIITLKSLGQQAVSLSAITISGTNAGDFTKTDTCLAAPVLSTNVTCTISVTYAPSAGGMSQATLTITDNAPGGTQQIPLTGMGAVPAPALSIAPVGTLNFPGTTTQGTSSSPENVTISNTGHGDLHVTNVVLSNLNSGDFGLGSANCVGTLAPNASCAISITFSPLASGIRTTSLVITDDAPNSPQTETISGNAAIAATIGPTTSGTTSATVLAGGTAQYMLQILPAQNFSGTISLSCSGAPLAATCHVPPTVSVTGGLATTFTVSVKTSGKSSAFPIFAERYSPPFSRLIFVVVLAGMGLVLGFSVTTRTKPQYLTRLVLRATALATFPLLLTLGLVACGGGSSHVITPPPVQVVTPAGTSTITITPTATSSTGKPIQLAPIQLTLTVQLKSESGSSRFFRNTSYKLNREIYLSAVIR